MHEMRLKECKVIYYPLSNNCFLLFSYSSMFVHFFTFILLLMKFVVSLEGGPPSYLISTNADPSHTIQRFLARLYLHS